MENITLFSLVSITCGSCIVTPSFVRSCENSSLLIHSPTHKCTTLTHDSKEEEEKIEEEEEEEEEEEGEEETTEEDEEEDEEEGGREERVREKMEMVTVETKDKEWDCESILR